MQKSLFLLLTTFAVLPAWHSCFGQDTSIAGEAPEASQQLQQDSPQKPAAMPPNTNPSSQRTTTPPPSTTSPSSSLVDTIDAGEMDDDIDHAPRAMASWNEYLARTSLPGRASGFWSIRQPTRRIMRAKSRSWCSRPKDFATSDSFWEGAFQVSRAE